MAARASLVLAAMATTLTGFPAASQPASQYPASQYPASQYPAYQYPAPAAQDGAGDPTANPR